MSLYIGKTKIMTGYLGVIGKVRIHISSNDNELGTVSGGGLVRFGDMVYVVAHPSQKSMFYGWYENGELVSQDITYSFVANGNKSLIAKFSEDDSLYILNDFQGTGDAISPNNVKLNLANGDYLEMVVNVDDVDVSTTEICIFTIGENISVWGEAGKSKIHVYFLQGRVLRVQTTINNKAQTLDYKYTACDDIVFKISKDGLYFNDLHVLVTDVQNWAVRNNQCEYQTYLDKISDGNDHTIEFGTNGKTYAYYKYVKVRYSK